MGTSNFAYKDKLFVVEIEDEWAYDNLVSSIKSFIKELGESSKVGVKNINLSLYTNDNAVHHNDDLRHYEAGEYGRIVVTSDFMNIELELVVSVLVRNGYYSDCNIDYRSQFEADGALMQDGVDAQDILDCYDNDEISTGLAKVNRPHLDKRLKDMRTLAMETFLHIANRFGTEYVMTNQFSNGETFYDKHETPIKPLEILKIAA